MCACKTKVLLVAMGFGFVERLPARTRSFQAHCPHSIISPSKGVNRRVRLGSNRVENEETSVCLAHQTKWLSSGWKQPN
ncbi:hypothetical protein HDK77DRAFT_171311 [Phyllosticta capitalensis]|uniref:uncharacterized protein n=1 Tax=Phyllosticta capitalensis TaxID=121624 RepID=UPI00312F85D3